MREIIILSLIVKCIVLYKRITNVRIVFNSHNLLKILFIVKLQPF